MKYKAVIFDLDGTLLDTLDDLADSTNMTLAHFGYPGRTKDEVRQFVGNGVEMLVRRAFAPETDEKLISEAVKYQRVVYSEHHLDKTAPYAGIIDLLKALNSQGVKTGVVSNKADGDVKELSRHFFGDLVSVSIGEKENVRHKPFPDSVLESCRVLNVDICDAVYVGDSETDIETADNAGMPCISVDWGFRDNSVLKQAGSQLICSSPEELLYILQDNDALHADVEKYLSDNCECRIHADAVITDLLLAADGLKEAVNELQDSFSVSLLKQIDVKGYTDVEVYKRAGLDRKMFSKLRSNDSYHPSKDTAIALCFAMRLSLEESEDLLAKAGYALSASDRRDVIIRYFLAKEICDLYKLNEALDYFGEDVLN